MNALHTDKRISKAQSAKFRARRSSSNARRDISDAVDFPGHREWWRRFREDWTDAR